MIKYLVYKMTYNSENDFLEHISHIAPKKTKTLTAQFIMIYKKRQVSTWNINAFFENNWFIIRFAVDYFYLSMTFCFSSVFLCRVSSSMYLCI